MATKSFKARAIVTRGNHREGKWAIEDVTLRDLAPNELLIQMVASGICHTDMHFGDAADAIGGYPRVMGHEGDSTPDCEADNIFVRMVANISTSGSGYVKEIGSAVKVAQPGDPVLLSFNFCGTCAICKDGQPSKCLGFGPANFGAAKVFYCKDSTNGSANTIGSFFGQSSFASYSIAAENSVVNAKNLIKSVDELKLLAPLGCGIQTGCGTITNYAKPQPSDSVAIMGLGGVGLSAIMGAKLAGCRTIIGIDKVESRLALAKELGATHVVNTNGMTDLSNLVSEVQKATDGHGSSITVDTTGVHPAHGAWDRIHRRKGQVYSGWDGPGGQERLREYVTIDAGPQDDLQCD